MSNLDLNPLSANPTKWSNTPNLLTNYLSVFDHFVGLALKGLTVAWNFDYFLVDSCKLFKVFLPKNYFYKSNPLSTKYILTSYGHIYLLTSTLVSL